MPVGKRQAVQADNVKEACHEGPLLDLACGLECLM